jgi:hypothetical protein
MLMAWDASIVHDPSVAGKMKDLAGGKSVQPGPEGKALFTKATSNLDFNSSDGTPASKYAGKSLDPGEGGRSDYLRDKLMSGGMSSEEASQVVAKNAAAKGYTSNVAKNAASKTAKPVPA